MWQRAAVRVCGQHGIAAALVAGWLFGAAPAQAAQPLATPNRTQADVSRSGSLDVAANEPARNGAPNVLARRLLWGESPGAPSTAKRAVVYGLYGTAGVATVSSLVFIARWLSDRSRVERHLVRNPGACHDLGAEPCLRLIALRDDVHGSANWATTSGAVAASALLGAVLTAHLWNNLEVTTSASQSGGQAQVRTRF